MSRSMDDEMAKGTISAPLHVLLAGGGTGGHVFPALSVARELQKRGHEVSFVGSAHGLEASLVADRGIAFHPLEARPLVGQGALGKVKALVTVAVSALAARRLLGRLGARAVVGTGGYVSAPAVLGARLSRRPALLLEPNAHTGVANRWLSRFATEVAVGYPQTAEEFHCPAQVTGVPVRPEFFSVPPLAEEADGDERPSLLVLGGSQGASELNRALPVAVVRAAAALGGLKVVHQCGERHLAATRQAYEAALGGAGSELAAVKVTPFLNDMAAAMAESDLIVSRAGAVTLAEICAAGRPALLIPLKAALDHQRDNGRILEVAGAAQVLVPDEVQAKLLAERLEVLLGDRPRLAAMGRAARGLAREDAAAAIADRVEALCGIAGGGR